MTTTSTKPLTFDEFITQYGDDPRYELIGGELRDMEPNRSARGCSRSNLQGNS